jgi:hypothetical protein
MGHKALQSVACQPTFRRTLSSSVSRLSHAKGQKNSVKQVKAELVSLFAYFSTLKMEPSYSSETSVNFQRITWRYSQKTKLFKVNFVPISVCDAQWVDLFTRSNTFMSSYYLISYIIYCRSDSRKLLGFYGIWTCITLFTMNPSAQTNKVHTTLL